MKQVDKTWRTVYVTGVDYEANLTASRLRSEGIEAVVMTKRDSAFSLSVGDLAKIFVLVPPHEEVRAKQILLTQPFSDSELGEIAEAADPFLGEDEISRSEGEVGSEEEE